jgi:hypothetical protein
LQSTHVAHYALRSRKVFEQKENERQAQRVKQSNSGGPDIAYPVDDEKWELQTTFFTAFVFEMWQRVEACSKRAAREARAELQTFLLNSLGQSLRLALDEKDSIAKEWACKLLAGVFVSIGKRVGKVRIKEPYGKLMEIKAFLDEKKRIGKLRTDVLFPGMVRAITQRELKKAGHFRKRLLLLSNIKPARAAWRAAAKRQNIPELYWPTVKLREFSVKYEPEWWKFLWPLIQIHSDKQELLELAERKYRSARTRRFGDLQKTARDHLKALARLRDQGVFYFF